MLNNIAYVVIKLEKKEEILILLPYFNHSMNNPLENDICNCPQAKVSYSKPREPLKRTKYKQE